MFELARERMVYGPLLTVDIESTAFLADSLSLSYTPQSPRLPRVHAASRRLSVRLADPCSIVRPIGRVKSENSRERDYHTEPSTMSTVTGVRLKDKVAIVTGGGSGFGRAISQRFLSEGCRVIIGDLNMDTASETIAKAKSSNENGIALVMDVTKQEDWKKAVDKANEKFGRLDVVVNNAGWSYKNKVRGP